MRDQQRRRKQRRGRKVEALDIEALREVVEKLSPHGKIVQLLFDEVFTYSQTENMLYGCGYDDTKEVRKTDEYPTILVFGIRSLLTAFNVLISAIPITSYNEFSNRCLTIAEEIGLDVKAAVSDRSKANLNTLGKFVNGKYKRKRTDGAIFGIKLQKTETDGDGLSISSMSYKIPVHADFLMSYSAIPGFYSWRNTSWFMQSLIKELNTHGKEYDILTLLTFVNQRVAMDYESCVPTRPIMDQQKHVPCIISMLTRIYVLRFSDKSENRNR
uniref:Caspase family p10 domain-containing protein n=1 Tax=Glossina palpalis gambiensis TaxID=67801 RepID=A0A1B0BYV4_9MUSC